jgi:hypothetical protein
VRKTFANYCRRRKARSITYWSLSVCMCVCACACARERVWLPESVCVCMRLRACSLAYPACNAYGPYRDVICGRWSSTVILASFHKWCDFRKNVIEHEMCVWIFSTTFV